MSRPADPAGRQAHLIRVATTNPGKAGEIARLLAGRLLPGLAVADLRDLLAYVPPHETGDTYEENAEIKALAAAAADPGAIVLADDSGIEVDALGGAPGIHSARWATGPSGAPLDGRGLNDALLRRLAGLPPQHRTARMVCAVALILPGRAPACFRGEVRGTIAPDQRGTGGFGYDALFLLPDGRRLSEVAPEVKDDLGHRGHAVRAAVPSLRAWLVPPGR